MLEKFDRLVDAVMSAVPFVLYEEIQDEDLVGAVASLVFPPFIVQVVILAIKMVRRVVKLTIKPIELYRVHRLVGVELN